MAELKWNFARDEFSGKVQYGICQTEYGTYEVKTKYPHRPVGGDPFRLRYYAGKFDVFKIPGYISLIEKNSIEDIIEFTKEHYTMTKLSN